MTETLPADLLVIGWGKGGKTLAATLAKRGTKVALVERSPDMYGGSCININCVPTKTLIHDSAAMPWPDAVARRDTLTATLRAANHAMLADADQVTLIDGHARFTGPHGVEVRAGTERLSVHAETIIINTGTVPATPFALSDRVHDSTTIQHVDPLPKSLAIIGSGFVGLEFAGMFAGFGPHGRLTRRTRRRRRVTRHRSPSGHR